MCWVALDRGAKIAMMLNKHEYCKQWQKEAEEIRENVLIHGWKDEIQSFSQTYDNFALDSSLLLMEPYGFIEANDIRYHKTVNAVKNALLHKGLIIAKMISDCPHQLSLYVLFGWYGLYLLLGKKMKHEPYLMKY